MNIIWRTSNRLSARRAIVALLRREKAGGLPEPSIFSGYVGRADGLIAVRQQDNTVLVKAHRLGGLNCRDDWQTVAFVTGAPLATNDATASKNS
jgi:hypothetical protein